MGLDMFLYKRFYIGAKYDHNKITGSIKIEKDGKPIKINLKMVDYIIEEAGYWRKANQIHQWFVVNVQNGKDDCGDYEVDFGKLQELKTICQEVLKSKDASKLPPQSGFFFGYTDIDGMYYEDLENTIKIIDSLEDPKESGYIFWYEYHSSW